MMLPGGARHYLSSRHPYNILRWGLLDDTARSTLLSGFRHVEKLEISSIQFDTSAQMNESMASFPSLRELSCNSAHWDTYLVPVLPLPLNITSIRLVSFQARFFNQLLRLESHPIVRTLEFRSVDEVDLKDVGMLLEELGHVEHLVDAYGLPQRLLKNNFSHNTHLRSIRLYSSSSLTRYC